MTIDFTCQKCEGSFELDSQDLIDGTEKLVCPHCDAKAPAAMVDDFNSALTEMLAQAAVLSKKFTVTLSIESEEVAAEDDEEEEAEEDDEASEDDDELDFDDDADEDEEEDVEDEDV